MRALRILLDNLKFFFKRLFKNSEGFIKTIVFITIAILFLLTSGHSRYNFAFTRNQVAVTYIILYALLGLLLLFKIDFNSIKEVRKRKKIQRPSTFLVFIVILVLFLVLSFLFNDDKSLNLFTYLNFLLNIGAIFMFCSLYSFEDFLKGFTKVMLIISVVSLVFYFVILITRTNFSTSTFLNVNRGSFIFDYFGLFFDYASTYLNTGSVPRLMGPFWEPGVFGTYLILALLIEVAFVEKPRLFNVTIFSVCLIFTFSTAAYLLALLLVIIYLSRFLVSKKSKIIAAVIALVVVVVLIFTYEDILNVLAKLMPDVFWKLTELNESTLTRLRSPIYFFRIFLQSPLFGVGGVSAHDLYYLSAPEIIDAGTSTYGYVLAAFGVVGFIYILLPLVAILLSKRFKNKLINILVMIIFIGLFNKENEIFLMVPNVFLFMFVAEMPKRFRRIDEFKTENPYTLKTILGAKNNTGALATDLVTSVIVRGLSLILGFMMTPVLNKYFGIDETFGAWLVVVSIVTWILTFDLGLGNGLKNKLIEARKSGNKEEEKTLISSNYAMTSIIAAFFLVVGIIIIFTVDLNSFMGIDKSVVPPQILKITVLLLLIAIVLELVLKNVLYIIQSYQKNALASSLMVISNGLLILFALFYRGPADTKMIALGITYVIAINTPLVIATIIVFSKKMKYARPSFKFVDFSKSRQTMILGIGFFVIQIGNLLLTSTNSFFISNLFGTAQVVEYEKYYKIFAFLLSFFGAVITPPIWVAITNAKAQGDVAYIKKLQRLTHIIAFGFVFLALIIGLGLQLIFDLWLGAFTINVEIQKTLSVLLYTALYLIAAANIGVCNGLSTLKTQGISLLSHFVLKIPFLIIVNNFFKAQADWTWLMFFNAVVFVPMIAIMPFEIKKELKKIEINNAKNAVNEQELLIENGGENNNEI